MPHQSTSLSTESILRVVFILLAVGFIYLIRDVLALFFIAIILSAAFDPTVDWLQRRKIPRALSIIGVYLLFFLIVGSVIYLLSGPIFDQVKDMSRAFPEFYNKIQAGWHSISGLEQIATSQNISNTITSSIGGITRGITSATTSIFGVLTSIFGGIIGFFLILVITFYLTVEEQGMKKFVANLVPNGRRPQVIKIIGDIQHRMGYWLRGQLILSVIIFMMVYVALSLLNVKYALILALVAGMLEIVPFLGPLLSAVPAIFFAFSQSFSMAVIVALVYLIIQQVENQLIVPKVMGKSTGLSPLIVILSLLTGARLAGVLGALLAVPVAIAMAVIVDSIRGSKIDK